MKNKTLLYLLLCGLMLYYAVPKLSLNTETLQGFFSLSWLLLAILVIGGNLSSFLYRSKKERQSVIQKKRVQRRIYQRS
ncbi:hypothetical protein [Bacillus sp. CGMCC 1.16541]|uniref:hypothetical protein n=1 Tax=Bacillus sp. CGMCC 1.16541 TaxID=2185143 RepID=UPI001EF69215|nr:hypothetical protein [Bacillus sp. CGMCC 1.16541]